MRLKNPATAMLPWSYGWYVPMFIQHSSCILARQLCREMCKYEHDHRSHCIALHCRSRTHNQDLPRWVDIYAVALQISYEYPWLSCCRYRHFHVLSMDLDLLEHSLKLCHAHRIQTEQSVLYFYSRLHSYFLDEIADMALFLQLNLRT